MKNRHSDTLKFGGLACIRLSNPYINLAANRSCFFVRKPPDTPHPWSKAWTSLQGWEDSLSSRSLDPKSLQIGASLVCTTLSILTLLWINKFKVYRGTENYFFFVKTERLKYDSLKYQVTLEDTILYIGRCRNCQQWQKCRQFLQYFILK